MEENHNKIMLKIISQSNYIKNSQDTLLDNNYFDTHTMFNFMNKVVNNDEYSKFAYTNLQYAVIKRKHDEESSRMKKRRIPLGMVNGKLIILPKDFKFTNMTSEVLV